MRGFIKAFVAILLSILISASASSAKVEESLPETNTTDAVLAPDAATESLAAAGSEAAGEIIKLADAPAFPGNFILTGAATYKIPIEVPTGRRGMSPAIELIYNSFQKNGWVGVGWTLDMGSIQRSTKYGLDYTKDNFVFTKNGSVTELIKTGTNEYRAKVDDGSFQKFIYNGTFWTVYDKTGEIYYYGQTLSSRQESYDPRTGSYRGVFKWCLDTVWDSNGNFMEIAYSKDRGEIYLSSIAYTGNVGISPTNSVIFTRETRTDAPLTYHTLSEVKTAYRLKSIQIYVSGSLVRKYELEYDADHAVNGNQYSSNTGRSLLGKIKRYGLNNTKWPQDMTFTWNQGIPQYDGNDHSYVRRLKDFSSDIYYYIGLPKIGDINANGKSDIIYDDDNRYVHVLLSTDDGFTEDTQYGWVRRAKDYNSNNKNYYIADFNGDGKTDFLYEDGNKYYHVLLSTGNDFTEDIQPYWGTHTKSYNGISPFKIGDVNGDGKADIVYEDGNKNYHILLSTGSSFTVDNSTGCGRRLQGYSSVNTFNLADVNNDGKADIVYDDGNKNIHVLISNGSCFSTDTIWGARVKAYKSNYFELSDVNADGLPDFVYEDGDKDIRVLFNTGSGFMADNDQAIWGRRSSGYNDNSGGPKLIDFDGDGLADFVYEHDRTIYVMKSIGYRDQSTGRGFLPEQPWGTRSSGYNDKDPGLKAADINGDGLVDLIYEDDNKFFRGLRSQQPYPDIMSTISNDIGGTYSITYEPSSSYENTLMPFVIQTVSAITVNDGMGGSSTTSYDYAFGYHDFADREFSGFGYVKQTNPDNTTLQTWFHQKDVQDAYGNYTDDKDFKGKPYHTEFREPWLNQNTPGTLLSKTDIDWDRSTAKGTYPVFVKLTQKNTKDYIGGIETSKNEQSAYDDSNGNLISTTTSGTDAETVTIANTYQNYGTWLWRNTSTTLTGSLSGQVRQTTFSYQSGTGNMLWKEGWLYGGTNPRIEMTYDQYGNQKTVKDARGFITTTDYDTLTYTYPVKTTYPQTNGVSHVLEQTYDYRFGKPDSKKDENGNFTYYAHDPFGRLAQVDNPDNGQTITQYYDTTSPIYTITRVKESASEQTIDKYEYFDGIARSRQAITFGEGGKSIVSRKSYDNMGRVSLTEGPFFSTGIGYPKTPPSEYPWTLTTYNYLGKPALVQSTDGEYGTVSSNISYSGLSTTETDPDLRQKKETKDYLGRIIKVTEYANTGEQYTNYAYNAAGDLKTATDHLGSITTISYDTLGRKTSMTDPDMGFWQYTYDANGNLKTQTDAKLQTITFNYDALNRVTTKAYSTSDPTVTYTYDSLSIPNGRGRLYSVTNTKVTTAYNSYDSMGRALSTTKTIEGNPTPYTTQTSYDLSGKTVTMTYPDNYTVINTYYPGTGLLYQVTGSDGVAYSTNTLYEPSGKMGQIDYYNGSKTRYSYDPWSAKLTGIVTTSPASTTDPRTHLMNRGYSYSRAGDINKVTDFKKGAEMGLQDNIFEYQYTYDNLHRLTNETTTNSTYSPINYTYNAIGSIMSKTVGSNNLAYTYHPTKRHAVNSITVNGTPYAFGYDNNGNMTNGYDLTNLSSIATRQISYNADNMPVQIIRNGSITSLTYDGDGTRAKKTALSGTTYYIGEHFEVINGLQTKHVFAGNLRIAKVSSIGVYYYHKDHIGSSSVMTNMNGNLVETSNYMPFGEMREHTGSTVTNYKFTDQELDPETGLYNYNARLYDAVIGRFISPDPLEPIDTRTDKTSVELQNLRRLIESLSGSGDVGTKWPQKLTGQRFVEQFIESNPDYAKNDKISEDIQRLKELTEQNSFDLQTSWSNASVLSDPQKLNRYAYVGNNPVNFVDPLGLFIYGIYNQGTGQLILYDVDTGKSVSAQFFSGGSFGAAIPNGSYDILGHGGRQDFYRLEPVDTPYGNDTQERTGRNEFRLHKPGGSRGCVTATDKKAWQSVKSFIEQTQASSVQVPSQWVNPIKRWLNPTETLPWYGRIIVQGSY